MKILITGGAGFIGINSAYRFIKEGHQVLIYDNLSRCGTKQNIEWLKAEGNFTFIEEDIRDFEKLKEVFKNNPDIDAVLHLAAQVAVTLSVENPRKDFEINASGTLNVCEAVRRFCPQAIILNSSTNKVYGTMKDLKIIEKDGVYKYANLAQGIPEERYLDFHSPYGCSKGAADQYVIDYARIYGVKTVNFRQSCIYGPHQFGIEDQGWLAWFAICALKKGKITIYGDGKQIRDILYIDDLIDCYLKAIEKIDQIKGEVFNIGGGPENILSPLGLIQLLQSNFDRKIDYDFSDWRAGDQKTFICDIRKAKEKLGWRPKISADKGVKKLIEWIKDNKDIFK